MAQGIVMHTTLKENLKESSETCMQAGSTVSGLLMTTLPVKPATKRKEIPVTGSLFWQLLEHLLVVGPNISAYSGPNCPGKPRNWPSQSVSDVNSVYRLYQSQNLCVLRHSHAC